MDITTITLQQENLERFFVLRNQVEQKRSLKINHRLTDNPSPTIKESVLGAFIEMYEPHLLPIVQVLIKKGYTVESTSGFCGEHFNCQALNGSFSMDYLIVNKLAKIGVKVQTGSNTNSIKFWPDRADMKVIMNKYNQIVTVLPETHKPIQPSQSREATKFRRTYIPKNTKLKRKRLFEVLMFNVLETIAGDTKKRITGKGAPSREESKLGVFLEMIEPQVRDAVIELNRKGYTTDFSGFMKKAEIQVIEGDFTIDGSVIEKLEEEEVTVTINHSGYTHIQFSPPEANLKSIKRKWMKIVSLFPDKGKESDPSMTWKAREFRKTY